MLNILKNLLTVSFFSLLLAPLAQAEEAAAPPAQFDADSIAEIKNGYVTNAALAQMHRQWTYYENDAADIANLLDTMADDVAINTPAGKTASAEEFGKVVAASTPNYANGHDLQRATVAVDDDGNITMTVAANYVSPPQEGASQAGAQGLNYQTSMGSLPFDTLPQFSAIDITLGEQSEVAPLENAYAANRLKSLIYYYNSLVENPGRNAEPFRELIGDQFNIDFGTGNPMTEFAQFEEWVAGPASSVEASTHVIDDFSYEKTGDNEYTISVDFSWRGILPNGMHLAGKTHHDWIVEDNPANRFPRIKDIKVSFIEPIGPLKN